MVRLLDVLRRGLGLHEIAQKAKSSDVFVVQRLAYRRVDRAARGGHVRVVPKPHVQMVAMPHVSVEQHPVYRLVLEASGEHVTVPQALVKMVQFYRVSVRIIKSRPKPVALVRGVLVLVVEIPQRPVSLDRPKAVNVQTVERVSKLVTTDNGERVQVVQLALTEPNVLVHVVPRRGPVSVQVGRGAAVNARQAHAQMAQHKHASVPTARTDNKAAQAVNGSPVSVALVAVVFQAPSANVSVTIKRSASRFVSPMVRGETVPIVSAPDNLIVNLVTHNPVVVRQVVSLGWIVLRVVTGMMVFVIVRRVRLGRNKRIFVYVHQESKGIANVRRTRRLARANGALACVHVSSPRPKSAIVPVEKREVVVAMSRLEIQGRGGPVNAQAVSPMLSVRAARLARSVCFNTPVVRSVKRTKTARPTRPKRSVQRHSTHA